MPFHYTAYGLSIASQRALPELSTLEESGALLGHAPDVEIVWNELPAPPTPSEWLQVQGEVAVLHFARVCTFRVSQGRLIEVSPAQGAEENTVRLPLLGAATAILLHQRGLFALHSSAVSIRGRAALFIGEKGQGKSTLASALYGRGHELLADDIAVITQPASQGSAAASTCSGSAGLAGSGKSGGLVVRPGFPQFKLVPDSLKATLNIEEHELPHVGALVDKRAHRVRERFCAQEVPLARVYVLGIGGWELSRPSAQQALAHVLSQSYAARFGQKLLHGPSAARHLAMCSRLVSGGFVRLLQRPSDLEFLGETARRIEDDIEHDVAQS